MISIHIEGMKFYAFHGHYPVEQLVGNEFIVALKIETEDYEAINSDKLDDALNYQIAYEIVKAEMSFNSNLLEHVANRILNALYSRFSLVRRAEVKISKLNPPMGGEIEKVSVTLSK
jgi:dihydroneopterin aldolase